MYERKWAYLREGKKKALVAGNYYTESGKNMLGLWLEVPFAQKVEEGVMQLLYKGETIYVPVDDVMFTSGDLFFV